jgi:hypothetical protein
MKHLLHGTRRELQKMGRLVDDAHLSRSMTSGPGTGWKKNA